MRSSWEIWNTCASATDVCAVEWIDPGRHKRRMIKEDVIRNLVVEVLFIVFLKALV